MTIDILSFNIQFLHLSWKNFVQCIFSNYFEYTLKLLLTMDRHVFENLKSHAYMFKSIAIILFEILTYYRILILSLQILSANHLFSFLYPEKFTSMATSTSAFLLDAVAIALESVFSIEDETIKSFFHKIETSGLRNYSVSILSRHLLLRIA